MCNAVAIRKIAIKNKTSNQVHSVAEFTHSRSSWHTLPTHTNARDNPIKSLGCTTGEEANQERQTKPQTMIMMLLGNLEGDMS